MNIYLILHAYLNRMSSDIDDYPRINVNSNTLPDVCIVTSENQPLLPPPSPTTHLMDLVDNLPLPPWNTNLNDDPEYGEIIKQAERAIVGGILPVRIPAGSSGSYFVLNLEGVRHCHLIEAKFEKVIFNFIEKDRSV